MADEELAEVFREWWLPGAGSGDVLRCDSALESLEEHLAEHGFAIVRRMDPDLPG